MVLTLVHTYNCTRSTTMGFSPYYLMCGQKPWLPIDLYFGNQRADMNATTSTKSIQQLYEKVKWTYENSSNCHRKREQKA